MTRTLTVIVYDGQSQFLQQGPKLVAIDNIGNAQQGYSVAVSADGNTAIVGGSSDNSGAGAAWIWTRSEGVWTQGPKLIGSGSFTPNPNYPRSRSSVSISADGNTVLVGSEAIGSGNSQQPAVSISLSADGKTLLVGGYGDNGSAEAVWVFTSTVATPIVTILNASNVNITSATLNVTVNPNGTSTTFYFDYGTTNSYGKKTALTNAGSGTANLSESVSIDNLEIGKTYHFRIVVSNEGGTVYGDDLTLKATVEYILKRIVNNVTDTYSISVYSWNFTNSINNMWPQDWWEQFNYNDNTYPPAWSLLASPSDFPDWSLYESAFGQDQCYLNPPPGVVIYNPKATLK